MALVPIFDGHNDLLLHLFGPRANRSISDFLTGGEGHIDLPKCKRGGLRGGFFALYIADPSGKMLKDSRIETAHGWEYPLGDALEFSYANKVAHQAIEGFTKLCRQNSSDIQLVHNASELTRFNSTDAIQAVLHFEGAEPIAENLSNLEEFYSKGLRSIGIVWSRPNIFGYGIPIAHPYKKDDGPGLTEAGKQLVKACNRMGIAIDISHLNEAGFWDVVKLSTHPIAATHCNVRTICNSNRNLNDRQLDAIKDSGGVIGVNFGVHDVRPDGRDDEQTPLGQLVDHFSYIVDRLGVDHVAFGSDFDGALMPSEVCDASGLQNVISEFRRHGFDSQTIEKLAFKNWMALLQTILK